MGSISRGDDAVETLVRAVPGPASVRRVLTVWSCPLPGVVVRVRVYGKTVVA